MQVRIVSVDATKKKNAVARVRTAFSDPELGSDDLRVFQRTSHKLGCFENHMKYWAELISSEQVGFWIFEDDVIFIRNPLPTLLDYFKSYDLSEIVSRHDFDDKESMVMVEPPPPPIEPRRSNVSVGLKKQVRSPK